MDVIFSNINNIGSAIGWTLIHFLWQGLLLFVGYLIITRIFLKNKIHFQYWIGITFIAMCIIIPIRELILQLNSSNVHSIVHQLGITIEAIKPNGILSPIDLLIAVVQKIIPYLVTLWLVSVIIISSHLAKSWITLVKLSKESISKIPNNLVKKLELYSLKLKLKFKPIITISQKIDIPATFGFFKPIILLPTSLINQLPQDQMEAILLHEMCHIKRADFLHNILQLLVETLFFYHPLTKWISRDVRKVREQCCDELVLELNANPMVYAKALTNIASIYNKVSHDIPSSNLQIAANDGELLNRIKFLMIEKRTKSPLLTIGLSFILSLLILFVFNNLVKENKTPYKNSVLISKLIKSKITDGNKNTKPNHSLPSISKIILQNTIVNKKITSIKSKDKNNNNITSIENKQEKNIKQEIISEHTAIKQIPVNENHGNLDIKEEKIIPNSEPTTIISQNQSGTFVLAKPIIENTYPKLIKKTNPIYKNSLRAMGIQGTVILSFNINKKGRVVSIDVDKSSPKKLLDGSARLALKKWRFDPNSINVNNISNRYQQIFSFTLGEEINNCINGNTGSRLNVKNICNEI